MKVLRKHLFTITSSLLLVSLFYRSPQLPESGNESLEMVSLFELRRSLLLNHCAQKKNSWGGPPQGLPKLPLKNLHMVRNLPGDLVFCLLKKGGSTSLNQFFLSNLQPSDEMTWIQTVEEAMQTKILESRSSLRVMVIRHPFTRLVSMFNHLFRWGLTDVAQFRCAGSNKEVKGCETQNRALAREIIAHIRPGSKDKLLKFDEFVRFLINVEDEFAALNEYVSTNWTHWTGLESHWKPFSSECSACHFLPHLILEVDNLSEELPFVVTWSGLARVYDY